MGSVALLVDDLELDLLRHDPSGGRWVQIAWAGHGGRRGIHVAFGTTGNRLDPGRRVRRAEYRLRPPTPQHRARLDARWPVTESMTHRIGQFVDDLASELSAANSPDPMADLATIEAQVANVPAPHPPEVHGLAARLLVSAYPLLRVPLSQGWTPQTVPLPVERIVAAADPRQAATGALGTRITRPLVRALAAALLPTDGVVAWDPLFAALMAAPYCGPEQITTILTTRPDRPNTVAFSLSEIDRARLMLIDVAPRRIVRRLVQALETPGGMAGLVREITAFDTRTILEPVRVEAPRVYPPLVVPPAPTTSDLANVPLSASAAIRAIVGTEVAGLRVCVPATSDELLEWGASMNNCLGIYRHAVAIGQTAIIGFEQNGMLEIAAEVSDTGVLRQLEAPGNRQPERALAQQLTRFLLDSGVARAFRLDPSPF